MIRPSVSIIIRNYNYGRFLRDAIDSALGQDYSRMEVVVIDDGSTDESAEILDAYEGRCVVVKQANGGEGSAINSGFAASTGDIIIFLDADDVLAPDAASQVAGQFGAGTARVCFPLFEMSVDGRLLDRLLPPHGALDISSVAEQLFKWGEVTSAGQSGNAYSRWALRKILPLDAVAWFRAPDAYLNGLAGIVGEQRMCSSPLGGRRFHHSNYTILNVLDHRAAVVIPQMYKSIAAFIGEEAWSATYRPRPATYHWFSRLISLRLSARHPFPGDRYTDLIRASVRSINQKRDIGLGRRLCLHGALIVIAISPRGLLRLILPFGVRLVRIRRSRLFTHMFGGSARYRHWRQALGEVASSPVQSGTDP